MAENTTPTIRSAAALVTEVSAAPCETSSALFMLSFPRAAVGLRRTGRARLSVPRPGRPRNRRGASARGRLNRHHFGCGRILPGTTWSVAVTVSRESNGNACETRSSFRVRHRIPGDRRRDDPVFQPISGANRRKYPGIRHAGAGAPIPRAWEGRSDLLCTGCVDNREPGLFRRTYRTPGDPPCSTSVTVLIHCLTDAGKMGRAVEPVAMNQPTLTRIIARRELRFGSLLFERRRAACATSTPPVRGEPVPSA